MLILLHLCAVLGLGASALLLVDYVRPTPVFCSGGGGCDVVRQSDFGHLLGVPTPALGVLFFAGTLLLALWPARRLLIAWTAVGALGALGFIALQLLFLHAVCKFCMVADGATLALAALAVATRRSPTPAGRHQIAVGAAAIAAALGPVVYARTLPPPPAPKNIAVGNVPDVIQREQRPGLATIVEFTDFECPYCRRLHATLEQVVKAYDGKVRVIRKQHPLSQIHPHAETAARAACCAEEAGRGDQMADALYTAAPDELTTEGCEKLAARVGVDVETYHRCLVSDRPGQRLAADAEYARAAGLGPEAPVFWIGDTRYRGAQPASVIRDGIDRALAR
jgi:protein-disulfide isomerase